ncbi:MAG: HNH/ENDO VII family nuclease [Culicoidibacterales bacterium]
MSLSVVAKDIASATEGIKKNYSTIKDTFKKLQPQTQELIKSFKLVEGKVGERETLKAVDIKLDDKDQFGRTNLERMQNGLPPLTDGKPMELHHLGQKMNSPLAELTPNQHRGTGNFEKLHTSGTQSEINRNVFASERKEHWQNRALDFIEKYGNASAGVLGGATGVLAAASTAGFPAPFTVPAAIANGSAAGVSAAAAQIASSIPRKK